MKLPFEGKSGYRNIKDISRADWIGISVMMIIMGGVLLWSAMRLFNLFVGG